MEEELYVKLGWPEYQDFQKYEYFDEYAYYDPIHDVYFIEKEWYDSHKK